MGSGGEERKVGNYPGKKAFPEYRAERRRWSRGEKILMAFREVIE